MISRSGMLDYKVALGTTKFLDKEDSYVVWRIALSNLGYLNRVLNARPSYGKFKVNKFFLSFLIFMNFAGRFLVGYSEKVLNFYKWPLIHCAGL